MYIFLKKSRFLPCVQTLQVYLENPVTPEDPEIKKKKELLIINTQNCWVSYLCGNPYWHNSFPARTLMLTTTAKCPTVTITISDLNLYLTLTLKLS